MRRAFIVCLLVSPILVVFPWSEFGIEFSQMRSRAR